MYAYVVHYKIIVECQRSIFGIKNTRAKSFAIVIFPFNIIFEVLDFAFDFYTSLRKYVEYR